MVWWSGGVAGVDGQPSKTKPSVPVAVSEPENLHPFALRGMVNKLLSSRFDLDIYLNKECQTACGQASPANSGRAR